MRKFIKLSVCAAAMAAMAMAADFSGTLLDSACYQKDKAAAKCAASASTMSFALDVNGKVYMLDTAGNTKAATAMKSRADRSKSGTPTESTVMAKITGTANGDQIAVDTVAIQ